MPYTFSTNLILQEAKKQKIKITAVPNSKIIELRKNNRVRYFKEQIPNELNSYLSHEIVMDKNLTKYFLKKQKIKVANGEIINKEVGEKEIEKIFEKLKKPLVVKPVDGWHGEDVFLAVNDLKQFITKVQLIQKKWQGVIVEEMVFGNEYRLLATDRKFLATTRRVPANVVGDGKKTLRELIEEKNQNRAETMLEGALVKIYVDEETQVLIKEQGVTMMSQIEIGRIIQLKRVSNCSAGGDSLDLTEKTHASIKKLAVAAVRAIPGLHFAGIDLICEDPAKPLAKQNFAIIEINDSPGFSICQLPFVGKGQPIAREFLRLLFR